MRIKEENEKMQRMIKPDTSDGVGRLWKSDIVIPKTDSWENKEV